MYMKNNNLCKIESLFMPIIILHMKNHDITFPQISIKVMTTRYNHHEKNI